MVPVIPQKATSSTHAIICLRRGLIFGRQKYKIFRLCKPRNNLFSFLYFCRSKARNLLRMKKRIINILLLVVLTMETSSSVELDWRCKACPPLDEQSIPLKQVVNARDLGGYMTVDGKVIRKGMLIRSASLATANDDDLALLAALPVVKVIDFRTSFEKRGKEDRALPGAAYISLPVQPVDNGETPQKMTNRKSFDISKVIMFAAFNEKAKTIAKEMYVRMVLRSDCQQQFAAFLREVVDTPEGAVLFHCSQGKDRTGLATAYLLSALGVDRETIIADFDKSNQVYAQDVRKYCRMVKFFGGKEEEMAVVKAFIGANTENFISALDLIDAEYGSMDAYLRHVLGLTDADFETLRARYLNSTGEREGRGLF